MISVSRPIPLFQASNSPIKEEDTAGFSSSNSGHIFHLKSSHLPLHHNLRPSPVVGVMHNNGRALHRQNTDPAVTCSTMFSVVSSSNNHTNTHTAPTSGAGGDTSNNNSSNIKNKKKSRRSRCFKISGLTNILKRASKKRPLSETQLRRKVKKSAERGDWDYVRKLITNYEFSDIPEAMPKRGSFNPHAQVPIQEELSVGSGTNRRPSYGSRTGGERRSFTGKESAAAAAVIKAAMLEEEEGSSSNEPPSAENRPDIGENILHDVCRFHPPLDVLETLLAALRHRRGSTFGTDDMGRTPLHLAANWGASYNIIDMLVRADPTPTTMGDNDRRSPLHLVMKHLVFHQLNPALQHHHHGRGSKLQAQERILSPEEMTEQAFQIVQALKNAMLTYPGKIDFKDEDSSGYSPLDYAIDGNITKEGFIQTLIRRKEPRCAARRRSSPHGASTMLQRVSFNRGSACGRSIYSSQSSVTGEQDYDILEQLEQDEVEARIHRIEKIKAKQPKEHMNHALFDVFGIEEQSKGSLPIVTTKTDEEKVSPSKQLKSAEDDKSPENQEDDDAIYNQHLEAYLDDYMDDFEGDLEEQCDEEGFDIFADPDLVPHPPEESSIIEGNTGHPITEIEFAEDEDCVSIVSEVTVPVTR